MFALAEFAITRPCPRCRRPNALTAARCLWCGAAQPDPLPADAAREVGSDIDALVREALKGSGSVARVRQALESAVVVVPPAAAPAPPPAAAPAPPPAPAADLGAQLDRLVDLAHAARAAHRDGDRARLTAELAAVRALVDAVGLPAARAPRAEASPPSGAPSLVAVAPSPRAGHVLVLDGRGDAFLAGGIALALGVDNATARQLALARFPRVALRGEDPVALESRAGKVRETLGVAARVVARAALAEVAPPRAVLAWAPGGALELTADAAWLGDPGQEFPARWGAHLHGVELAVAGEIVLRRFRAGPDGGRGRGREVKVAAERRIGVLDLHGPRVFLRVTEGISRLDALPGGEPGSARRSFKALEDGLPAQVPGVRLTPARVCAPGDPPALGVVEASPDGVELSGWPEWEEHTRLVRALHGIGPERD